jgi:hypothetical protein
MGWISYALVVILLYTPLVGLGRIIQEQEIPLEIEIESLPLSVDVPYTGYIRLFLYSVAGWLFLWGLLFLIERISKIDLLAKAKLRNGMLYARRPYFSNNLVSVLASVILVYPVVKVILTQIDPMLGDLLPYNLDIGMIVLSVFTLIVSRGFRLEQRYRYEADVRRNQRRRKRQQTAIVIPTAQE